MSTEDQATAAGALPAPAGHGPHGAARRGAATPTTTRTLPLTVAVLARDEAPAIGRCLAALAWAEEVLVVDGGSVDATPALARARGARVVGAPCHLYDDFGGLRNLALAEARHPWVLFLDVDEEVSPALLAEIGALPCWSAGRFSGCTAYALPRRNILLGRALRYGGWWPDRQVRLVRRDAGHYVGLVHERFVAGAAAPNGVGRLRQALIHRSHRSVGDIVGRIERYSRLEARQWHAAGRPRPVLGNLVARPVGHVLRRYLLQQGFRDGRVGLIEALLQGWYVFRCLARARGPAG